MTVIAASGFRAAGVAAGIKPDGAEDMTLIVAESSVPAAAVFTTSATAAPPVLVSRRHVTSGRSRAVIVNSGAANAGTGSAGVADALAMAGAVAAELGCDATDVLVCSTGPIGGRLPMATILASVPTLVESLGADEAAGLAAARGIMTTDSVEKTAWVAGDGWTVGGIAKGAGMVRPDMATMLAFLTTDAVVDSHTLSDVLRSAVDGTFNALNIDGCQSTNDTVIVLASGASGRTPATGAFAAAVHNVCADLAHQMARDAEGASKVVRLDVSGALDDHAARRLGLAVADSALVRSSFFGADPNWGRVLAALGAAGEKIDPDRIEIAYDGTLVCAGGTAVGFDEAELSARLTGDFRVGIRVGDAAGRASVTTTDLTPDYVIFNGERS
jgi:glutamate N-acetyltransferase/amino-acid N-acetyltransferase